MLTVTKIRKSFGTKRLLHNASFSVHALERVALVGPNGAGKSTLLKMIAALEPLERGSIEIKKGALVGYLPQETIAQGSESAIEFLRSFVGITDLEEKMRDLEPRLSDPLILSKYEALEETYRRLGGYHFLDKAKGILDGLALVALDLNRPLHSFSGGEKRKLSLAGVLLLGVDLLLLDEPTNNLDLPALLWLERYLISSKATLLVASHDRAFLDRVATRVIEIDTHTHDVKLYNGNWSTYAETKAHLFRRAKELYRLQEEEKERVLQSAQEKNVWVERTKKKKAPDRDKMASNYKKERAIKKFTSTMKSLESRVKRLDRHEKPFERAPLAFDLLPGTKTTPPSLALEGAVLGYAKKAPLTGKLTLRIPYKKRVVFLGTNGMGKSTLLKTLTKKMKPLSGKVTVSKTVVVGDLMQEHEDIPLTQTPLKYFAERFKLYDEQKVRLLLARFQFSPEYAEEKIGNLSPGERVRFIMATLVYGNANVLVLDEPTNHLDVEAIEALEEALEAYVGTVLLVTHDRSFLSHIHVDAYYLLDKGKLSTLSSFGDYAKRLEREATRRLKRLEERLGA